MTSQSINRSMQFFLRRAVDEAALIPEVERILGFEVKSIDGPLGTAPAVYWFEHCSQGFATHITVDWSAEVQPLMGNVDAALRIARFAGTDVVTDLPEYDAEADIPGVWCLVEPTGKLFAVGEDESDSHDLSLGLV